jgi:hypothetical protein
MNIAFSIRTFKVNSLLSKIYFYIVYINTATEYSECGSRARLNHVTLECATYASSGTSLLRESESTLKPTL